MFAFVNKFHIFLLPGLSVFSGQRTEFRRAMASSGKINECIKTLEPKSGCEGIRLIQLTNFCIHTSFQILQTCRKLIRNTNQLFSELHSCLSGGGGYAVNATQLNKVKKDTQERMEWKK